MYSDDEFDYETIAAQEREEKKDVTKAESLSEAFECFGASTDDVLTHREMVLIYGHITHAMARRPTFNPLHGMALLRPALDTHCRVVLLGSVTGSCHGNAHSRGSL